LNINNYSFKILSFYVYAQPDDGLTISRNMQFNSLFSIYNSVWRVIFGAFVAVTQRDESSKRWICKQPAALKLTVNLVSVFVDFY
jgi:hypothetical protein